MTPTRNPSGIEPSGELPESGNELQPPREQFRLASWPDGTAVFRGLLDVADPRLETTVPEPLSLTFKRERETKNTVRFQEEQPEGATPSIGALYLQKPATQDLGDPEQLTVVAAAESA